MKSNKNPLFSCGTCLIPQLNERQPCRWGW